MAPPPSALARRYTALLCGLALTSFALWIPMLIRAPNELVDQVLVFQAQRPVDGSTSLLERMGFIFAGPSIPQTRHLAITVLAVIGVIVILSRRREDRLGRVAVIWFSILVLSFMLAATYWDQYNAALAPSMSVLGAAAVMAIPLAPRDAGWSKVLTAGGLALVTLAIVGSLARCLIEIKPRSEDLTTIAADIAKSVSGEECVVSFEPGWLVAADRLPAVTSGNLLSADPYAAHLLLVVGDLDERTTSASEAFASQPASTEIDDSLRTCRYLLLGERGHWQLSAEQMAWITTHYRQLPTAGSVDLWERAG